MAANETADSIERLDKKDRNGVICEFAKTKYKR